MKELGFIMVKYKNLAFRSKLISLSPFITFAIAFVIYGITLAPTFSWGDSSDLAQRTIIKDFDPLNFDLTTRDYEVYRFLSGLVHFLLFLDPAVSSNLTSAIFGALTVGFVTYLATLLTKSSLAGLASGISLTVSHTFWLLSTIAEVYTLTTFLVFSAFTWMTKWVQTHQIRFLFFGSLTLGLLVSHHPSGLVAVLFSLIYLLMNPIKLKWQNFAASILLLTFGSFFYFQLVIHRYSQGANVFESLAILPPKNLMTDQSEFSNFAFYFAYLAYNFAGPALILIVIGLAHWMRNINRFFLPPLLFSTAMIFAGATSSIPDKYNIYVLTYPGISLLVGLGVISLKSRFKIFSKHSVSTIALLLLLPPMIYFATFKGSVHYNKDISGAREVSFRNNAEYFLWPPKNNDFGPRRYAELALSKVSQNGILIADYTLYMPLIYLQSVENVRPDVEVIFVESLFDGPEGVSNYLVQKTLNKRVYLATNEPGSYYQLDTVLNKFNIKSLYPIFEVFMVNPK